MLRNVEERVKVLLAGAEGGHDWWHAHRVRRVALRLAHEEGADPFVVELAALLHDIADPKFHDGDEEAGPRQARHILDDAGVPPEVRDHVLHIIRHISFRGGHAPVPAYRSPELAVVQDADRLDALGAIGIARTFNYGGYRQRPLYDPTIPPRQYDSAEEYRKSRTPTINHFYEKLLLLKDRMNTTAGKKMAEQRHRFMESFLEEFFREWKGER